MKRSEPEFWIDIKDSGGETQQIACGTKYLCKFLHTSRWYPTDVKVFYFTEVVNW